MKIGKVRITAGPNIPAILFTVLVYLLWGWKGLLIFLGINVAATLLGLWLRKALNKKELPPQS